jgi:hypothetical protein
MTERIEYYPDPGKKCDYCTCWFGNSHDMNAHLDARGRRPHGNGEPEQISWRKSTYDDGEWCPCDSDPQLKLAVQQNGKVIINGFEITLSPNGKWLRRKKVD